MFQRLISRYRSRLRDFWYESQKKRQKNPQDIGVSKAERRGGLEGFQTDIHPGRYMAALY